MSKGDEDADAELEEIRRRKKQRFQDGLVHPVEEKIDSNTQGQLISLDVLNFWEIVQKNEKVLVECYATWCKPCKALDPILKKLAKLHRDIIFANLDIDQAAAIAEQFQIQGVPTLLFFRKGLIVNRLAGSFPFKVIEANIQKLLS